MVSSWNGLLPFHEGAAVFSVKAVQRCRGNCKAAKPHSRGNARRTRGERGNYADCVVAYQGFRYATPVWGFFVGAVKAAPASRDVYFAFTGPIRKSWDSLSSSASSRTNDLCAFLGDHCVKSSSAAPRERPTTGDVDVRIQPVRPMRLPVVPRLTVPAQR